MHRIYETMKHTDVILMLCGFHGNQQHKDERF